MRRRARHSFAVDPYGAPSPRGPEEAPAAVEAAPEPESPTSAVPTESKYVVRGENAGGTVEVSKDTANDLRRWYNFDFTGDFPALL